VLPPGPSKSCARTPLPPSHVLQQQHQRRWRHACARGARLSPALWRHAFQRIGHMQACTRAHYGLHLSSSRTHTRSLNGSWGSWASGQAAYRCLRLTLRSTRSPPCVHQLHAAPRGPTPTPATKHGRSARKERRRTGDALRGGERGRARGRQLLRVLRGQLQRGVVQARRQLQRLARCQLRRLCRLRSRLGLRYRVRLG
jgi:hypothetical protein